jgi:hypothetical protein
MLGFQVDQICLKVDPSPFQPQHFISSAPSVERQADKVRQVRSLRFAFRS